jgi:hypothetical protein
MVMLARKRCFGEWLVVRGSESVAQGAAEALRLVGQFLVRGLRWVLRAAPGLSPLDGPDQNQQKHRNEADDDQGQGQDDQQPVEEQSADPRKPTVKPPRFDGAVIHLRRTIS